MTLEDVPAGGVNFRLLFESVPGLFLVLLPDLSIAAASDAYLRATLTSRAQTVGRHLFDVFPDNPDNLTADGVAKLRSSLQRVIQNGLPDVMPLQRYDVPRPDGNGFEERYWSPSNYPVMDEQGRLLYIIHRVEDVTDYVLIKKEHDELQRERHLVEQECSIQAEDSAAGMYHLHALNRALKLEILARNKLEAANSTLTQQLQRNIEQLEASNKELENFSYSVSHDLRAPLRAIEGFSRILEEDVADQLDVEARRKLQVIRDNARNMGRLIEVLLDFSRLGRNELSMSRLDMTMLARTAFEAALMALSKTNPDHHVCLYLDVLPEAHGDLPLIHQVWLGLLANACKFSAKNPEASIWVSGELHEDRVRYHIRDNGAGFDMRYQAKLFGMFQRLHRTTDFEGIGAGLAIVQRILARHGGQIEAQGSVGEGATFTFSLPIINDLHDGELTRNGVVRDASLESVQKQAQTAFHGLLLAAGRGMRFDPEGHDNKLLAKLPGTSLCVVEAAALSLLAVVPVLAVVPSLQSELAQRLAGLGCKLVACGTEPQGMSASLMCGVRYSLDAAGWIVALGDMPFVQSATHAALLAALQGGVAIAAPSYRGKRGNPVAFSAAHREQLLQLQGDQGARSLLQRYPVHQVPVEDAGILRDIDTRADLEIDTAGTAIAGVLRGTCSMCLADADAIADSGHFSQDCNGNLRRRAGTEE